MRMVLTRELEKIELVADNGADDLYSRIHLTYDNADPEVLDDINGLILASISELVVFLINAEKKRPDSLKGINGIIQGRNSQIATSIRKLQRAHKLLCSVTGDKYEPLI